MAFDIFVKNSQTIFDNFPNDHVWVMGGLRPNRQLQRPEAGYCIVIRYDKRVTDPILHFMAKIGSVLPPIVEYSERELHTTIGTYGKGCMEKFVLDKATLQHLAKSVERGMKTYPRNYNVQFGKWLYNDESIIISGYPSQDLWHLFQSIRSACKEEKHPLEMGHIVHITTARFISSISFQDFEQFRLLLKSAPAIETSKPSAIDIATWCCNGHEFDLATYESYHL